MNKTVIVIIVIILLGVGAWFLMDMGGVENENLESSVDSIDQAGLAGVIEKTNIEGPALAVKEFTITGDNFKFSLSEMKVKKGDTVKLTFKNENGTHDWRLDEFDAKTDILKGSGEQTIEFIADKAGTFEFYCSVGSHRKMGMKGDFIVEE